MKRFCFQDAVNKAIPAEPTVAERPPIGPAPGPPTASSATSTPEEAIASYSPFSSAGTAKRKTNRLFAVKLEVFKRELGPVKMLPCTWLADIFRSLVRAFK